MPKDSKTSKEPQQKRLPGKTPELRENQLIALALALVEKRLLAGTASSQETTHFLKIGSTKEKIEKEILEKKKDLITAQTDSIKSQKRVEELYTNAMSAFRAYSGNGGVEQDDDD